MIKAKKSFIWQLWFSILYLVAYLAVWTIHFKSVNEESDCVIRFRPKDDVWRVVSDISHLVNKSTHSPNPHVATSWILQESSVIMACCHLQIICSVMATETVQLLPQEILKAESGVQRKRSFCSIWTIPHSSKELNQEVEIGRLDKILKWWQLCLLQSKRANKTEHSVLCVWYLINSRLTGGRK